MAKSFAQYASQFLTQHQAAQASLSSSQPLFFSFTTDAGSRAGNDRDEVLDDLDDPHLRSSGPIRHSTREGGGHRNPVRDIGADEEEDPYLRLDEDDLPPGASRHAAQSMPLIASNYPQSEADEYPGGWLAHQTSPPRRALSPSVSSSSSRSPPPDILQQPPQSPHRPQSLSKTVRLQPTPPPPPPARMQEPVSLSLTQSLLPRDGTSRPLDVFSLPDPRFAQRARRRLHDHPWTLAWCTGVAVCVFSSILILFLTSKPKTRIPGLPYTTLLHTVPMLTILTLLSAVAAYTHVFLLRFFVRPVMLVTSLFIPVTLFISAIWAFVGSFMWDGDTEPTWGETVGLRLFSLVPLVLCALTARRLVDLPREIHTTSAVLDLATQLLIDNPFLLALSPAILLVTLVTSIPFLTLIFRLLLVGYTSSANSGVEFHVKTWADWAIVGAAAVWLWTWGVARGILRTTSAGVIGAWYFADPDVPPPLPMDTYTIHAALLRSTSPSLGSICLSALILTGIRLLGLLTLALRALPSYFPLAWRPLLAPVASGCVMATGYLETVTTSLSKYALVYTGLTGDPFFPSARRARALTTHAEEAEGGRWRRRFKKEPALTMLTYSPLTLTFPFALGTYLFVAHTLGAPDSALGAAVLAAGVTALVGLFCVGLVKDTADALYLCYCIDKDVGERRRDEVFAAFEYELQPRNNANQRPHEEPQQSQHPSTHTSPVKQQHYTHPQSTRDPELGRTAALSPGAYAGPSSATFSPPRVPPPLRQTSPTPPLRSQVHHSVHDADIDPFEHEPADFAAGPENVRVLSPSKSMLGGGSGVPGSVSPYSVDSDDHAAGHGEDGEESQLFPGSDLF